MCSTSSLMIDVQGTCTIYVCDISTSKTNSFHVQTMSDLEKQRFQAMATTDKERYEKEMSNYTPADGSGGRKRRRKQKKDPNAPKRCM